jgi:hypothetical protein
MVSIYRCWWCITIMIIIIIIIVNIRAPQIFQKRRRHLKILGASRVTWRKFHTEDLNIRRHWFVQPLLLLLLLFNYYLHKLHSLLQSTCSDQSRNNDHVRSSSNHRTLLQTIQWDFISYLNFHGQNNVPFFMTVHVVPVYFADIPAFNVRNTYCTNCPSARWLTATNNIY